MSKQESRERLNEALIAERRRRSLLTAVHRIAALPLLNRGGALRALPDLQARRREIAHI